MFTFIKQYAEKINGAHIYAFISLFIFLLFFIVLLVFVKKMGKEKIRELSNIPFDREELNNSTI
jgi:cytochrome c oxidase cbb3-type subunit IV